MGGKVSRRTKSAKSAKEGVTGAPWNKLAQGAYGTHMGAPHEVHQFEQAKYFNEPLWDCRFDNIAGAVGCIACENPRPIGGEALIVQIKAMYKRKDFMTKDDKLDKPRNHCVYPGRGEFWSCFNTNLVIEPDSDWLGDIKDKPLYLPDGSLCTDDEGKGDCQCYPGDLAAAIVEG